MIWNGIDNPVVRREARVLQRGKIPAVLIIGGPVLTGLLFIVYHSFLILQSTLDPARAQSGRALFSVLSLTLFWGLMLFVPALVGASINKDRRAGTLSTLRMTHLNAWQILLGKLVAFCAFYSLVFLVTTPIVGMTFLLGGVSVSEFIGVFFLTLAAALQCSVLSLMAGLLFRRSATALLGGALLALVYILLLPNLPGLLQHLCNSLLKYFPAWEFLKSFQDSMTALQDLVPYVFPSAALGKVFAPGSMPTVALGLLQAPFWMVTMAGAAGTSLLTLALTAYLMRKELWLRPARGLGFRLARGKGKSYRAENLLDERRNPFLAWEMERHPVWRHRRKVAAGVGLLGYGLFMLFVFLMPMENFEMLFRGSGWLFLKLVSAYVMFIPIIYCSQTVVREKEMGTYDALVLTLLQPKQILVSKLKSCFLYVAPVLALAAVVCLLGHFTYRQMEFPFGLEEMNFVWLAFQVVRCIYYAMLGIFFSLYCRTTLQALAFTAGAEILLTLPYAFITYIFGCCGLGASMAFLDLPMFHSDGWGMQIVLVYAMALIRYSVRAVFLFIVARVLYDRSINLMRFESYRR